MKETSTTELEASRSRKGMGPRGGKQDKNISIRLPSTLVEQLDQMAQDNGEGRSELIRNILEGVLTVADAGFSDEQIEELKRANVAFYRFLKNPMENMMYLVYRANINAAEPDFQKQFALAMSKSVIALANTMTSEQKEIVFGALERTPSGEIRKLDQEDEEFFTAKILKAIQRAASTGAEIERGDQERAEQDAERTNTRNHDDA